jgi:phenylacetate-CoA ligase
MRKFSKTGIYNAMPVRLQNTAVSVLGYLNKSARYGRAYWNHRQFLKGFDSVSLEEKLKYQQSELIRLIKFAGILSPFYRDLYRNVDLDSITCVSDLQRLPVVDKEMLRANLENVFTIPAKGAVVARTGGTTGKSLVVRRTTEDMMKRMAMLDHFKSRVGFENLAMRRATFNGKHVVPHSQERPPFWRYNAACKQMIYSPFHFTEDTARYYVESLNNFRPAAIDGFFTSIVDIASYIDRRNIKLLFKPVAIFPTSETLTSQGRQLIESVFGCKVYDQYASSEGAPFVTECSHQRLHIELSSGVFERYSQGSDEILVTSFTSYGTPLIRYRIGDEMIFEGSSSESCACGSNSPLVRSIKGRNLDFLYTPSGVRLNAGIVSNLFKNLPNCVIKAQLIQDKFDEVQVLLQVDSSVFRSGHEDFLRVEFKNTFGNEMRVNFKYVKEIPREVSGKFRFIKNNISAGNLSEAARAFP